MGDDLRGSCHCGGLTWVFHGQPEAATICNCTLCRRYGVLWAYDIEGERIEVQGRNMAYIWGSESIGFHFCPDCGCVAYWRALAPPEDGRRRIAVNLRLAEPARVEAIPLYRFDGFDSFDDLPPDGSCVRDRWF